MQSWIISLMEKFGYFGTFFMIFIENIFPPIPSEVILTFGGFMTTTTNLTISGMVIAATTGSVAGAGVLYGLGRMFTVEKVEKFIRRWGYILRLKVEDIQNASNWFEKRGYVTVFICRMIPLLRSLISIPAGMAEMNFGFFLLYTTIGTLIWNIVLVVTGALLGENWGSILKYLSYYSNITYAVLAILAVLAIIFFYRKKKSQ